jgi:hypothetical protein
MTDTASNARLVARLRSRLANSDSQAERLRLAAALAKLEAANPELVEFAAQSAQTNSPDRKATASRSGHWPTREDRDDLERKIRARQAADAEAEHRAN